MSEFCCCDFRSRTFQSREYQLTASIPHDPSAAFSARVRLCFRGGIVFCPSLTVTLPERKKYFPYPFNLCLYFPPSIPFYFVSIPFLTTAISVSLFPFLGAIDSSLWIWPKIFFLVMHACSACSCFGYELGQALMD